MLEFKGLDNKIHSIELELKEKGELSPQAKSLILNMRTTIALLKGQYNLLNEKYYKNEKGV